LTTHRPVALQPAAVSEKGDMSTAAWVGQIVLGILFLLHGLLYAVPALSRTLDRQREARGLPRHIPLAFQRFIGVAEIAGAVAITIPAALHVLPWLTPLAALGLAVVGFSAAVFHLRRREISMVPVVLVLGLLAAFVAYVRTFAAPLH
jgi:putative oxidoreductase